MLLVASRSGGGDLSMLLLLGVATTVLIVILGVVLAVVLPARTRKRNAAWAAAAAQMGMRFVPAGAGIMHASAILEGTVEGVPVRVDTISTGRRFYTRVRARGASAAAVDARALDARGAREVAVAQTGDELALTWLGWETDRETIRVACGIVARAARFG